MLSNADNNVQKASEQLTSRGYEKKDTTIAKTSMRKKDEAQNDVKNRIDKAAQMNATPVSQKPKTEEEKTNGKAGTQSGTYYLML